MSDTDMVEAYAALDFLEGSSRSPFAAHNAGIVRDTIAATVADLNFSQAEVVRLTLAYAAASAPDAAIYWTSGGDSTSATRGLSAIHNGMEATR